MTSATSSCRSGSIPEGAPGDGGAGGAARPWAVRRLEASDVRSWERVSLELPRGLILVTGPNGAGKTSLVEAVVLGCLGVSPRTARESEIVRHGAPALHVALDLEGPEGVARREIGFAPGRGRRLRVDGALARSLAEWRARGSVLVFLPDELRSVKGPPAARRRALDRVIEAVEPGFADDLAAYQEALAQRNALLRRVRAGVAGEETLPAWEARMAGPGARVAAARRREAEGLSEPFRGWLEALGGGAAGTLALEPSPRVTEAADPAELEREMAAGLLAGRARDVRAAQTLSGPHRDDVLIAAGPTDLRRAGSQGEQRTAALAFLLAARDRLRRRARPVLLLDDVLSELDPGRRRLLLEAVRDGGQTVVTTADPAAGEALAEPPDATVHVEGGRVRA